MGSSRRKVWAKRVLVGVLALGVTGLLLDWYVDFCPSFGATVAFIGDANGDGTPDFAVGEWRWGWRSSVTVVSGRTGRILHRLNGSDQEEFGKYITAAGDQDGDGTADLAASTRSEVRIISGRSGAVLRVLTAQDLAGKGESGPFCQVAGLFPAGEIDGDGSPDFDVKGLTQQGRPFLAGISGRGSRVLRKEWLDIHQERTDGGLIAPTTSEAFLALVRDRDGDGVQDRLIVRDRYRHRVLAVSGKTGASIQEWKAPRAKDDETHNPTVAGVVSDLDGDGVPEIAYLHYIAAGDCNYGPSEVLVQSTRTGEVLWTYSGEVADTVSTLTAAAGGDLDGDGFADILAGEVGGAGRSGFVRALSGKDGRVLYTVTGGRGDGILAVARFCLGRD